MALRLGLGLLKHECSPTAQPRVPKFELWELDDSYRKSRDFTEPGSPSGLAWGCPPRPLGTCEYTLALDGLRKSNVGGFETVFHVQ